MGPLFFRAENRRVNRDVGSNQALQWGRSFSERRTRRMGWPVPAAMASMGPLFFRAENPSSMIAPYCVIERFNGAALFQSGERRQVGSLERGPLASMGPLFFRAENWALPLYGAPPDGLQWGCSFSERRTCLGIALHFHRRASMGPLFFRAENVNDKIISPLQEKASMVPLFFRAENWSASRPAAKAE